jgi:PAS domain S-box-containing protein
VLLVDDKPENLLALRSILGTSLYRLVSAGSGAEALRAVLEEDFAVIVLDVLMPEMDGFEVASTIKLRARSRRTPIIFLTAAGTDLGLDGRGYEVGAVDYLSKPISPSVLRAKVAVFADLFRKSQEIARQAELLRQAELRERDRRMADIERQHEVRYQRLADAIPHLVWRADRAGRLAYLNERFRQYLGEAAPREGECALDELPALHADDREAFRQRWREARDSARGQLETELRLQRADGTVRWHLFRALPDVIEDGSLHGWLGTFTDIEDEKRAQVVLEAENRRSGMAARASSLLDLSFDAAATLRRAAALATPTLGDMCVVDVVVDGRLRRAAVYGSERADGGEAGGAPSSNGSWAETLHQAETFSLDADLAGVLSNRSAARVDDRALLHRHLWPAGPPDRPLPEEALMAPLWARGSAFALLTIFRRPGGEPYGEDMVALAGELVARASMAVDNARLYQEAVEAVGARDEFLSIASHELKTPLTSLTLHVQSLLRKAKGSAVAPETLIGKLEVMTKQTDRLERLIEQLLDVSRAAAGLSELSYESFDLSAMARDVQGRLAEDAAAARAPITVRAEAEVVGHWDRVKLEQAVTNLVTNAIKYGRGRPIEVEVLARPTVAIISVRDHGIGLAPEQHQRVFERFERAVSSREFGGLGLGLYITRRIVEAHGGSVTVRSDRGQGATFTIELPYDSTTVLERGTRPLSVRPGPV